MTAPKKTAARRLGPDAPSAGTGQPPWAMVSPDGSDLYFPTKAEDAQAFAREFGAQPVDTALWPWQSILRADGKIKIGAPDDDDAASTPPEASSAAQGAQGEQGGHGDQPAAPTPPALPERARQASGADLLAYCPTPNMCFPLGLPVNVSHVACVHGSSG